MATDTLSARSNGQTIDETWYNVIRSALGTDFDPRNSSGVAIDGAGTLGTNTLRWLNAYLMAMKLMNGTKGINFLAPAGLAADYSMTFPGALPTAGLTRPIRISDSGIITFGQIGAGEIANGVVTTAMFDPTAIFPMKRQVFASSSTWTCPANVNFVMVLGRGGSGGGGSGGDNGTGTAGGGGGAGCRSQLAIIPVTPGTIYTVTIGAAGTGGAAVDNTAGNPGTAGGDSTFADPTPTVLAAFKGGAPGLGGGTGVTPTVGAGGAARSAAGGNSGGGNPGTAGAAGGNTEFGNGGGGGAASGTGGGGGGGGAGDGDGGSGGAAGVSPGAGGAGTNGGGGGGGGGGVTGTGFAGAGGSGSNGQIILGWT
jgi:hypothetical protein